MKCILTTAFVFLVSFVGISAQAACTVGWCDDEKITRLWAMAEGNVLVESAGDVSQLNCTPSGGNRLILSASQPGFEAMYSMLLTAKSMDIPVGRISIVEGSSNCEISYVFLN